MTELEFDLNNLLNKGELPTPAEYQYYKNLQNNTIIINEEISDNLIELAILPIQNMDEDPNVKEINIYLNTLGGDIYSGFAFVSVLERLKIKTTIHIVGMAESMGALIAMAITEATYKEIGRQEFWMDAEDMLKYGIVDEML